MMDANVEICPLPGADIYIEVELQVSHEALLQLTGHSGQHDVVLSDFQDVQVGQTRLVLSRMRFQDDHPV